MRKHCPGIGRVLASAAALGAAVLAVGCPADSSAVKNEISTLAGTGAWTSTGDGAAASASTIKNPNGIALGADGSLYFSDSNAHRIRRIDAAGTVSAFAGTGIEGMSGDSGPALSAQFEYPQGLAVDASGDLYVADSNNCRIRKIAADGTVSTLAGGGGTYRFGGDGATASAASLNYPTAIAIDVAGSVYIADSGNNRIRKVDGSSGIITTVAGTGVAGYSGDGGLATAAQLNNPWGVAVDAAGDIIIADTANNRIRKVDASGVISTIAGTGVAGATGDEGSVVLAALNGPKGVTCAADGSIYVADTKNFCVRTFKIDGNIRTVAGICGVQGWDTGKDGGAATETHLADPNNVLVDSAGNLIVSDGGGCTIRKVAAE